MQKIKPHIVVQTWIWLFFCLQALSFTLYGQTSKADQNDSVGIYKSTPLKYNAERLNILREQLAIAVNKYIDGFALQRIDPSHLEDILVLRAELKSHVIAAAGDNLSSETLIAVNKANIGFILDEINSIEKLLGDGKGEFTSELNVLDDEELRALSRKARDALISLEKDAAKFPRAETPSELSLRLDEIKKKYSDIENEFGTRQKTSAKKTLVGIDRNASAENIKKADAAIKKFNGPEGEKIFDQKLKIQIELRLHRSPSDASLRNFGKYYSSIEKPVIKKISARPPPSTWKDPVKEVLTEIRSSVFAEQDAIELSDKVVQAEATANAEIYTEWIKRATGAKVNSPYELLSTQDLQALQLRNTKLAGSFHNISAGSAIYGKTVEINDVGQRLSEIQSIINKRPDGFDLNKTYSKIKLTRGPPLVEFESRISAFEKYITAKHLRIAADKPTAITDPQIKIAYDENISSFRKSEAFALDHCKGANQMSAIDELITTRKLIIENENILTNGSKSEPLIKKALEHTRKQTVSLAEKVNKSAVGKNSIYCQSPNIPSVIDDPITDVSDLKPIVKPNYPVSYEKSFPQGESWTKSLQGLIKDIKKAPGGVIIDPKIEHVFLGTIKKAEFDIFSSEISVCAENGQWKKVDISRKWVVLRQAWAFVNDGRVAAVDVRPFSSEEADWFINYLITDKHLSEDQLSKPLSLIPDILTINLHPSFQNTFLGKNLLLADQVIFDLLPVQDTRIIGQYKQYEELGLDVGGLRDAYLKDFLKKNTDVHPRTIMKSIISISTVTATEDDAVHFKVKPDFAIFLIPDHKSDRSFIKLENSSKWFNEHASVLMSHIRYLKDLDELACTIAFFKAIRNSKIENNFNDLVYLLVNESPSPTYIFPKKETQSFIDVTNFLQGTIK